MLFQKSLEFCYKIVAGISFCSDVYTVPKILFPLQGLHMKRILRAVFCFTIHSISFHIKEVLYLRWNECRLRARNINDSVAKLKAHSQIWNNFWQLKNIFYFILKALLILKSFIFLFWLFGQVEKWLG